jgi:tetratricopeptide (TPR) repeat protein
MTPSPAPVTAPSRRRRTPWVVGGLLLIGVAVFVARQYAQPALDVDAAEAALRRNDPAAARLHLERVLAGGLNDGQVLLLSAVAARRIDAYADAERYLTAFEDASRPTEASRLEWVLLGAQQGDFGGDEDSLRAAVGRNHPEERAMLEALAKGYDAAYRWPDSLAAVNRLLEREPDHAPALVLRAALAERFRRTASAEEDLRRAVTKAPDNAIAQAALAGHLSRHGHTREAIYHYELARRLRPADPATRLGLARALADAADTDGAARQLDALLADDPNHADALVERGRLAVRRGQFAEAEPFLERAARAAPWHRDGHQLHFITLKELGRTEAAAKCEARLAELDREDAVGGRLKLRARDTPGDVAVRMELWEWSKRNGQTGEGVAWLTEVLRADRRHAGAHAAFADYFDRAGQPRRAAHHRDAAAGK